MAGIRTYIEEAVDELQQSSLANLGELQSSGIVVMIAHLFICWNNLLMDLVSDSLWMLSTIHFRIT